MKSFTAFSFGVMGVSQQPSSSIEGAVSPSSAAWVAGVSPRYETLWRRLRLLHAPPLLT
jgi:hypothetical protein